MARKTRKPARTGRPRGAAQTLAIAERRGRVLFGDISAGEIEERPDGAVVFRYLPAYLARPNAEPVSLTLPLAPEPVENIGLHAFFDGLSAKPILASINSTR